MARYFPDEITYELFGIDPDEFYKTKFACGQGLDNALAHPVHRYELTYEKIRRLIDDLQSMMPAGGKALDVGCGAAPYGPTLLANVPGIELYGVDMSRECLKHAGRNGYSNRELFNLTDGLPYKDQSFDFVFSMDTFGHIEFRHKDFLIAEISRVTKPGGAGHHGVETGFVDYFDCEPMNANDPVRQYVLIDGHIGAEPAQVVCDRFARCFPGVSHRTTYLYPFVHKGALGELFEKDFGELLAQHNQAESVQLANLILGRLNSHFIDEYARVFGCAFKPDDGYQTEVTAEHRQAREKLSAQITRHNELYGPDFVEVPRQLFRPAGFSSITVRSDPGPHN
jgi:ubiquinone/menaquinone biosynthesis C-methylase UbiE